MDLSQTIKSAWLSLGANKNRSFLTMLGIIIGIASVIVIFSVGKGAESLIYSQFTSIGSNLIAILPGAADEEGPPASVFGITITTLKNRDIAAVEQQLTDEIIAGTGYVRGQDSVVYGNQSIDAAFVGVESDYLIVEDAKVAEGRFFSTDEEKGLARVAVLGSSIAEELFFDESPLGKKIKIGRESFIVIGVMAKRGTAGFVNQDRQVFVPLETAQKILLGIDYLTLARLRVKDGYDLDQVSERVRQILREQHNLTSGSEDDFSVRNLDQAREVLGRLTGALSLFLAAIGAISLLVGGIGIMNIMLVAVNERVQEIGLRRAVGAKARDIELQFLVEAVLLTFLGALVGIFIGVIFSALTALVARGYGLSWQFQITPFSVLISCVMAVLVGVVFGYYPARRAAQLKPIEALRYE